MAPWEALLARPAHLDDAQVADAWFQRIATQLLNGCHLIANGHTLRLVEVEVYYHGPGHRDPFAHQCPVQQHCGRWYFHRTHGSYRGGSFKGLDLAFGDEQSFAGVLFRSFARTDGTLVVGPSLCVDHLLGCTGMNRVAALDHALGTSRAWDLPAPLTLVTTAPRMQAVYRSARVGLSLKRTGVGPEPTSYLLRPYRFLTEPRRISKGKTHLVLSLLAGGHSNAAIAQLTGSPRHSIERCRRAFAAGQQKVGLPLNSRRELSTSDLCQLHGIRHAMLQAQPTPADTFTERKRL